MGDVVLREETVELEAKKSSWGAKKMEMQRFLQSRNLRNLEIALRILRIPKLPANPEITQPILRLRNTFAQSRDCASIICERNGLAA